MFFISSISFVSTYLSLSFSLPSSFPLFLSLSFTHISATYIHTYTHTECFSLISIFVLFFRFCRKPCGFLWNTRSFTCCLQQSRAPSLAARTGYMLLNKLLALIESLVQTSETTFTLDSQTKNAGHAGKIVGTKNLWVKDHIYYQTTWNLSLCNQARA